MACWFQAGFTQWWQKMAETSPSAGWVVQDRIADMIDEAPWWGAFAASCPLFSSFIQEESVMVPEYIGISIL